MTFLSIEALYSESDCLHPFHTQGRYSEDHGIWYISMRIPTFSSLIFAEADMAAFCTAFMLGGKLLDSVIGSPLWINRNCNSAVAKRTDVAWFTTPLLKSLMGPLHILCGFRYTSMIGSLDEACVKKLRLSSCRRAPSFLASLSRLLDMVEEGGEAFSAQKTTCYYF